MAGEIHKNDIGTAFRLTILDQDGVGVNLIGETPASSKIIFLKPDKTQVTQDASFATDGSDGVIEYLTVLNDLDQIGAWKIQGKVVLTTGSEWYTTIGSFKVIDNLV